MRTEIYATLDEALNDIAKRSFYEGARVTPNDDGTFTVSDEANPNDDSVYWTYGGGMETDYGVMDNSRVMEPAETFATAAHIRYNLSGAVSALEDDTPIQFHYVIVDAYCDLGEDNADCEFTGGYGECMEDHTVGWALLAYYA